jgi:hypothetical protein
MIMTTYLYVRRQNLHPIVKLGAFGAYKHPELVRVSLGMKHSREAQASTTPLIWNSGEPVNALQTSSRLRDKISRPQVPGG